MDTVKRVYQLAAQREIPIARLAQMSGIAESTIKMTRRRGGQLKIDTIERICQALGISLSTFFSEQESGPS